MKILGVDPGQSDPFALVLIQISEGKIWIIGARFFKNWNYEDVLPEIRRIVDTQGVDQVVIESNAPGKPVIDALRRRYDLSLYTVFTSSNLKEKKEPDPHTMDKAAMANWMIEQQQEGILNWPSEDTEFTTELKRQWKIFGEYKKGKYEAPSGDHDDLMMALMLACFYAKFQLDSGGVVMINADRVPFDETIKQLNDEHDRGETGLSWDVK